MASPQAGRKPLARLADYGRLLRTITRMIVADVELAREQGEDEERIRHALGFAEDLQAEVEALRRWAT